MTKRSGVAAGQQQNPAIAGSDRRLPLGIRLARRALFRLMYRLGHGRLVLTDSFDERSFGTDHDPGEYRTRVHVADPSFYLDVILRGTLGAAEAFMQRKWDTTDLTSVVRILLANRDVMERMNSVWAWAGRPFLRLAECRHRNTRSQSRRNIHSHYDLGNEFFELFLDPTMMYSSAVYPHENATLEEASLHKLDLICQKLQLGPDDHLLEIGTGWGGLAMHAAQRCGCRVTTTTISNEQYTKARQRIDSAGLSDRITLLKRDYRDLEGQYDKLVSVEMIEAVGPEYLDTYFEVCSDRLKPNGRMLLQAIVIDESIYDRYIRSVDFIRKYIFPGGALPALPVIQDSIGRVTDLRFVHLQDIGADYARTLREWYERFTSRLDDVRRLGYPDEFIRMWQYYFCYCEGGFREKTIRDLQIVFDKPACRLPRIA